jgi:hypothetical protein
MNYFQDHEYIKEKLIKNGNLCVLKLRPEYIVSIIKEAYKDLM